MRAKTINMEMKIAAAKALADLAREDVPDEVANAYHGARPRFGRDYLIPAPFDPRLISIVPPAVALAAMDTGVARRPDRRHERLSRRAFRATRSDRRPDADDLRSRAARSQARCLRRGRRGAGHPRRARLRQSGIGTRRAGRPRGSRRETAANAGLELGVESKSTTPSSLIATPSMRSFCSSACSARAS